MKIIDKIFRSFLILLSGLMFFSCVDDVINPDGPDQELPENLKEGYSISFRMSLDPMGGSEFRTRASSDLKDIEDFVDLEKVRILFFTCQYSENGEDEYLENGKTYDSGLHDYFLFESSSRWVSEMQSTSANASKLWQVTVPVFPYGNQDADYNWERIREAITGNKFKIVILANRPPQQRFPDYDNVLGGSDNTTTEFMFDNQGPYWGSVQSWANNTDLSKVPTINDLHHCQWDPVYTSKNSIDGVSGTTGKSNGNNIYDFIMGNPDQVKADAGKIDQTKNQMGAVSQWTVKGERRSVRTNFTQTSSTASDNYAIHPKKNDESVGGIPMYGVQKFEPVNNWSVGTPFNISENQMGQDNAYFGKTISLLRSVVRMDLLIPKSYFYNNTKYDIELENVCLICPNVMARVVPLDAATPTDILWANDNCSETTKECEWYRIQERGPIIAGDYEDAITNPDLLDAARQTMMSRMGWFYGAWRKWWHFNTEITGVSAENDAFFGPGPYPHIFNPCVQRNALVWLDGTDEKTTVLVPDASFYHYVVYMGERYINDPSNFRELLINKSKICFFQFTINCNEHDIKKTYQVAVTDYSKNSLIKEKFLTSYPVDNTIKEYDLEFGSNSYRNLMVTQGQNDHDKWNWSLLRNHIYRFQITSFGDLKDDGVDGMVIATEERTAPDISYY